MIGFLRFIGIANAAVWFGSNVFFTFFSGPAFFSPEMKALLPPPYNGAAAELIIQRFFILQHWCGGIALAHFLLEWFYFGRAFERITLGLLVAIFSLGLAGGFWLRPKLHDLHLLKYRGTSIEQKEEAAKSFKVWHGLSQMGNLITLPGLLFYLWRVTSNNPSRTIRFQKSSIGWQ